MAKRKKEPTYYPPGTILQYDGPMGFYPVEVLNWNEIPEGYDNRGLRVLGEARIRNIRSGKERLEMQFRLHKPKTPNPGKTKQNEWIPAHAVRIRRVGKQTLVDILK